MRGRSPNPAQRLVSPVFLGALGLRLLNDLLLKPTFHNWATGKLSDGVGLYAFACFWMALFPRRRVLVGLLVAVVFAWWKSPLSGPALVAWNAVAPFPLARTVDYTDLLALPAILVAGRVPPGPHGRLAMRRPTTVLVILASLFAFTATSARPITHRYDRVYVFFVAPSEIEERVGRLGAPTRDHSPLGILEPEETEIEWLLDDCWLTARLRVSSHPEGSALHLFEIEHRCTGDPDDPDRGALLRRFESRVVDRLEAMP